MEQTIDILQNNDFTGLCFVNLVDFDALWGHRRNPEGYAKEVESFDVKLGELLKDLKEDDLLMITADHGNDPTYKGTDHTREYIPVLVYGKNIKSGVNLGIRNSFADIGATVADILNVKLPTNGTSFKAKIM